MIIDRAQTQKRGSSAALTICTTGASSNIYRTTTDVSRE